MTDIRRETSVLIIEAHSVVAYAVKSLLHQIDGTLQISVCGCAPAALDAVFYQQRWGLIILDLDEPDACGLALARRLSRSGIAPRCAVISAHNHAPWIAEVKQLGMRGYITKLNTLENFIDALTLVLNGHSAFPRLPDRSPGKRLTRRQQDILSLVSKGYSSKKIASQLGIALGTVDNHMTALMRALGVSNRTHATAKAIELGYI